ncbi:MAG TPA: efflux transporter outer membrane subunit [Sphingomicrobium sp.]|nr:efflux transporter outer membrane subunit [Sphingomicrobium sp.]
MKRAAALLALLATACTTMEPRLPPPDPAIPPSWPAGDATLIQAEAALPAVTYREIFRDPRLQTLIARALANNRNLMAATANIAAAREQFRVQRAQELPTVGASGGVTLSGDRGGSATDVSAQYQAGVNVPNFEIDLFGRKRSLTQAQFEQYLGTEAGARATRLALVASIANAWLDYAGDLSLLQIAQQTADTAGRSVRLTRLRLEGGIAPRTDLSQAEQILTQAQADVAQQRTFVAQGVNTLRLLVGARVEAALLPGSIEEAGAAIGELPAGVDSYVLLRRPDILQAEHRLRAANAQIGAARAALFPRITLTGLLGLASSALTGLFSGGAFAWSAGGNAAYTIFQGGAGQANVRLTEAQRNAALANYQGAVQTAFREVADALARRATMDEQLAATERRRAASADVALLEEARYRAGIASYLSLLDAQRSYYAVQRVLVQTRLTAARNRVAIYQAVGGDSLLQTAPLCAVVYDNSASSAKLASQCSPI